MKILGKEKRRERRKAGERRGGERRGGEDNCWHDFKSTFSGKSLGSRNM